MISTLPSHELIQTFGIGLGMLQTPFVIACVLLVQHSFPLKGLKIRYPFVACRVAPKNMHSAYDVLQHNKSVIYKGNANRDPFLDLRS